MDEVWTIYADLCACMCMRECGHMYEHMSVCAHVGVHVKACVGMSICVCEHMNKHMCVGVCVHCL